MDPPGLSFSKMLRTEQAFSQNYLEAFTGEIVGRRRTAKLPTLDRAISMSLAERNIFEKLTPGINFLKFKSWAQSIFCSMQFFYS